MPVVSVKVTVNKLPAKIKALRDGGPKLTEAVARKILEYADEEVPVRTGELQLSGDIGTTENGHEVFYSAPHAIPVHNGTTKRPANPFLSRAVARALPDFEQAVSDLKADFEGAG